MALTDKKRQYVAARLSGLSGAKAAIAAGYSDKGAAQAAARLNKDPDVIAALQRAERVNNAALPSGAADQEMAGIGLAALGLTSDPKRVLVALMNDTNEEPKLRLEAAKALMPFVHARVADQGKKAAKNEAAKKAANRFAPSAPPLRMVKGGG